MIVRQYNVHLFFFILVAIVGFLTLGLPGLTGEIDLQTYSDSLTYERLARNMPPGTSLISVSSNLVGPIWILRAFDYSYPLIFAFNIIILLVSFRIIFNHYDLNKNTFLFFVFIFFQFFQLFLQLHNFFSIHQIYLKNHLIIYFHHIFQQ